MAHPASPTAPPASKVPALPPVLDDSLNGVAALFEPVSAAAAQPAEGPSLTGRTTSLTEPVPPTVQPNFRAEIRAVYDSFKNKDVKLQGKLKCEEAIHSIQLELAKQYISESKYDLAEQQISSLLNLPQDAASLTPVQKIDLILVISQHVNKTNRTLQWRATSQSFVDGLQASIQNLNSSDPNKLILLKNFASALELLIPVLDPKSDKDRRGLETLHDQCLKEAAQLSPKPSATPLEAPKVKESSKTPQPPAAPPEAPKVEEPPKVPQPHPSSSFWKYTAYTAVALGAIALAALALRRWRPDILQRIYKL